MRVPTLTILLCASLAAIAYAAETYILTSYYPAPYGKYDSMLTNDFFCNNDFTREGNIGMGTTTNGTVTAENLVVNDQTVMLGDARLDNPLNDPFIQFQRASGAAYQVGYQNATDRLDIRASSALTDQVLTVTRTGRVGMGANGNWTPTNSLHVAGDSYINTAATIDGATIFNNTVTINGAAAIAENDLTLQRNTAGANAQALFSNSGNNSSAGNNGAGEFRISPITNSIDDAVAIDTATGLGIRTGPGANALNVSGTAYISGDSTFSSYISVTNNIGTDNGLLRIRNVTLSQGTALASGVPVDTLVSSNILAAPGFHHTSDQRLKENISPLTNALAKVSGLKGVSFNFKALPGERIGLLAQEVEKVVPEVVATSQNNLMAVEYDSLVGLLIEAIKEQQLEIEYLQRQAELRFRKK